MFNIKGKRFAPSRENEGAIFALFIAKKSAKISLRGQTCGQGRKMLVEEQAYCYA